MSSFSFVSLLMLEIALAAACWLWGYLKAWWCCKAVSCACVECIECDVLVEGAFWLWLCDGSTTFTFVIQQPKPFVYGGKNNKKEEGFVRNCSTNMKFFLWKTFFFLSRQNLFRFFLFLLSKAVTIASSYFKSFQLLPHLFLAPISFQNFSHSLVFHVCSFKLW